MEQTLDAALNPSRANAMAAAALGNGSDANIPEPPKADLPPDTLVALPGGSFDPKDGQIVKVAEVRELNGFDEEALSRIPHDQPARVFQTILKQGVVNIGSSPATQEMLDDLLTGDRDTLLLAVRRVTWGDILEVDIWCPNCDSTHGYGIELSKDIPIKPLEDTNRTFTLTLPSGNVVQVHLPDGHTQAALLSVNNINNRGQLNTTLLQATVDTLNGLPVAGPQPIQRLSLRDRQRILTELGERAFGPRFEEVSVLCQSCGEKILYPLSLSTLFPA